MRWLRWSMTEIAYRKAEIMATSTHPSSSPVKILIAEDSPTQAQQLRHILERDGYEVEVAGNGRLALEMVPRFKPALIISDVIMPEMDGYELARRIKAAPDLRDIPVILVTTMSDPEDVIRGLECGADNFVLKPYDERFLLGRVRYVLINREMRGAENNVGMGVEVYFNGQKHFITADRLQILNLLLSTYDAALQRNKELQRSQEELELLNAQLEAAKEAADSANRAKSTFLAVMSHEIRTPLNGIFGMLELLSLSNLAAEQRSTLNVARESGKSLQRIIDDILDFSKIEAGKLEVSPAASSVSEVLESTRNIYRGIASSKGLLLSCSVDPRISPALWVDPGRLRQILNNLVSNAIKFTSKGAVEMKAELLARQDDKDTVRFSVKDSGIGISPEAQARLFQPFVQAEAETAREFGGTGLGLTICKRLAHLMGGSIEMTSELGRGTEMSLTLSLPVADPNDLASEPAPAENVNALVNNARPAPSVEEAERESTLVLLVDDHPINRMLLCRQIDALGYAAESAENGVEALEKWKSGRFAAVITDCNMPEMDGYDLARTIRMLESQQGRARIPVIACTANALSGDIEVCLGAGMDDYLPKPVQLADLTKKLRQWLPLPREADAIFEARTNSLDSAGSRSSTASPVDASVLNAICDGVTESARQVLLDFWSVNDEDVSALERAVAGSEHSQIARAAHRIKGASRMIGAFDLAALCERIEQATQAEDLEIVRGSMNLLHQELERLNRYISSL